MNRRRKVRRRVPARIKVPLMVDNGPEFISNEFRDWCESKGITVQYTQPGKPMQNGYIERFNRTFRENILDAYLFEDIYQVQILSDEWMEDYNYSRPHEALGGTTPDLYKRLNCYNNNNYIFELNNSIKHQSELREGYRAEWIIRNFFHVREKVLPLI